MFLSRDEVRALDRRAIAEYGVPGVVLMENAGRSCAELLRSLEVRGPVVLCCGKGNNGGDGFVIARHLDNRQIPVRVLLFAKPEDLTGDAAVHYQVIARAGLNIESWMGRPSGELSAEFAPTEWIVDALFGTGLDDPLRGR